MSQRTSWTAGADVYNNTTITFLLVGWETTYSQRENGKFYFYACHRLSFKMVLLKALEHKGYKFR